jgi:ribosomal protein L24E
MKKNPVVKGRMYRVSNGGSLRGIRFRKDGKVEVLVSPKKRSNPKKKRKPRKKKNTPKKRRPTSKRKINRNKKRITRRPKAKRKK